MTRYKLIIILLITFGLSVTLFSTYLIHARAVADNKFKFEEMANDRVMAIQRGIESSVLAAKSTAGLFFASEKVTREEFSRYVSIILNDLKFIRAIEWVPKVDDADRDVYESEAMRTFPEFHFTERNKEQKFVVAGKRDKYFPIYYIEPYTGNEKVLGFDLASESQRKEALYFALDNDQPSSTGRIHLMQENTSRWGFLMYIPVYIAGEPHEAIEQRQNNILGFVVAVFDISSLVESSLSYLQPVGINFTIFDVSPVEEENYLYTHKSRLQIQDVKLPSSQIKEVLSLTKTITVNNRKWSVFLFPSIGYFQTNIRLIDYGVFISGCFFTLLLASYIRLIHQREYGLQQDNALLEKLVSERTKELEVKNKELESYSYSIAHDLRTPLRTIVGFSQIIKDDAEKTLSEDNKESLNRIIQAGKFMAQLIDDILNLSRMMNTALEKNTVNLSAIVKSLADQLDTSGGNNTKVEWVVQDNIVGVCDHQLITILLSNLLGNAYKYTSKSLNPKIEFGETFAENKRCYYVKDNGIGFDMKYSTKIFGMFQRLHKTNEYEGTGVGLATVQRIIERHHGQVWVESKKNGGATFFFTLEG